MTFKNKEDRIRAELVVRFALYMICLANNIIKIIRDKWPGDQTLQYSSQSASWVKVLMLIILAEGN